MIVDQRLRDLYAAAWMRGLEVKVADTGDVVVVSARRRTVPLDDTQRAPVVPLRPDGGDRGGVAS